MLRDMKDVSIGEFTPGTVVMVYNGVFNCLAVVFEMTAWRELCGKDIPDVKISKVEETCPGEIIPLRILGGARSEAFAPDYMNRCEPNDDVIVNYAMSNLGGDICIIDDVTALLDSFSVFRRVFLVNISPQTELDLKMLKSYLDGDHNGEYLISDNQYGRKMLALFRKGIPR